MATRAAAARGTRPVSGICVHPRVLWEPGGDKPQGDYVGGRGVVTQSPPSGGGAALSTGSS